MRHFAPKLGLDPDRVSLFVEPERDASPRGEATAGAVRLWPAAGTPPSASLIVHELAHVAQHANRARRGAVVNQTAAEAEAEGLAGAVRSGAALWIPRAALPDGLRALDTGASGISARLQGHATIDEYILHDVIAVPRGHTPTAKQAHDLRAAVSSATADEAKRLHGLLTLKSRNDFYIVFNNLPDDLKTELLAILKDKYEQEPEHLLPTPNTSQTPDPLWTLPTTPFSPQAAPKTAELTPERDGAAVKPTSMCDHGYAQHKYCRGGTVPNNKVPEDEATCEDLLATATASLGRQRTRAAGMLDAKNNVKDFRYWFAKVYSFVTENEIAFVRSGAYYYPSYVLRSVLYFEQIFGDNVRAADRGDTPEAHWKIAFDRMAESKKDLDVAAYLAYHPPSGDVAAGLVVAYLEASVLDSAKSLTEGMKAHIRYDLPRAEAWVFNKFYATCAGVALGDFKTDFMSMAGVFDNAGASMQRDMADKLSLPVDETPSIMQDATMKYWFDADMGTERADTWQRAEIIRSSAGTGPYATMTGTGPAGGDTTSSDNLQVLDVVSGELKPSMDDSAYELSTDSAGSIKERIKSLGPDGLKQTGAVERVRWIRRLIRGATYDSDREGVIAILAASKEVGDITVVIDAADAYDVSRSFGVFDSGDYSRASLDAAYLRDYYSKTAAVTAIRLIQKCIVGETSNWEKSIVVNILEVRSDIKDVVTEIGKKHPDSKYDDLNAGVAAIRWAVKSPLGGFRDRAIAAFTKAGIPSEAQPK